WALGGEQIVIRLAKKTLYVGFFAFLIGNFNTLAGKVFDSFAKLGLTAGGGALDYSSFLQPGRLAHVGIQAGRPILEAIGGLMSFTGFFANFVQIVVLLIAWLIVVAAFFILAVQLFITLIEFKLTTLAGFVLVPFGLWGKSAFLAERVLGFVITCGVKVLVLAVIVGIGTTLFGEFISAMPSAGTQPTIDEALALVLAAAAMLGLGIFGPAIASGLVSGAPQLGAGAAIGTAGAIAGGALLAGGAAGAAFGLSRAGVSAGLSALRAGTSLASATTTAYGLGVAASGETGIAAVGTGVAGVGRAAAGTVAQTARSVVSPIADAFDAPIAAGRRAAWRATGGSAASAPDTASASPPPNAAPEWARRLRAEQIRRANLHAATQAIKEGDRQGGSANPELDRGEH
ncbi:MAG TPA: P-type conjugative transfer protein TrbL, partial [Alphaproteobacteria bacterium]|nr:P-type conjugative transfer protein TrbL [Alphaproteobacteria bacterium]